MARESEIQQPFTSQVDSGQMSWTKPRQLMTKNFFFGNLDWFYFFRPLNLYSRTPAGRHHLRFRRNYEFTPLLMSIFLGFQHALVAIPFALAPGLYFNYIFPEAFHYYMLQSSVLIAGICTILGSLEIKIGSLPIQFGTGLISILVSSTTFMPAFLGAVARLHLLDHEPLGHAYSRVLGAAAVCSVVYMLLTWIPRKYTKKLFPPYISALLITLVGLDRMVEVTQLWGGGVGCAEKAANEVTPELVGQVTQALARQVPPQVAYQLAQSVDQTVVVTVASQVTNSQVCTGNGDVHLLFGSAEYIGLGVFVLAVYLICELYGSPFVRHNIYTISLILVSLITCLITFRGDRYITGDHLDDIPPIAFLWTTTYKIRFYDGAVMPLLGAFLVAYLETVAVLTSTVEDSKIDITTEEADNRIQGGLITSSAACLFSVLATGIPIAPCAANNSVLLNTGQASKSIGISAGIWICIFGIFGKLLGLILEIPVPILGGFLVILLSSVVLSGIKRLSTVKWDRRMCVIIAFVFVFGLARVLVHEFVGFSLWRYDQDFSDFVVSFRYAVILTLRESLFLGGFMAIVLNLILPAEMALSDEDLTEGDIYEPVYDA